MGIFLWRPDKNKSNLRIPKFPKTYCLMSDQCLVASCLRVTRFNLTFRRTTRFIDPIGSWTNIDHVFRYCRQDYSLTVKV